MTIRHAVIAWGVALGPAVLVCAQSEPDPGASEVNELEALANVAQIGSQLQQLGDWQQQHDLIDHAINRIWQENGWTGEADLFARDTALEVAKIPPWEFDRRINAIVNRVSERYDLTPETGQRFKQSIYGNMLGMVWNNREVFLDHTREMVRLRARGEPFTPELVAKWIQESEPIMQEVLERSESIIEQFSEEVDDEHRHLLEADMQSFLRRVEYMEQAREKWARGEWTPEAWGLEVDPIHQRAAAKNARPGQSGSSATSQPASQVPVPYDPATWPAYVQAFAARFDLDPGQRSAADSILVELVTRANEYVHSRAAVLAAVPVDQRATDPRYDPVRVMFGELQERLNRIPTGRQRSAAQSQPTAPK